MEYGSTGKPFLTRTEWIGRVHDIFASLDRPLTGDECDELCVEYFATNNQMTLPGQALFVDLRPAFRVPLADVTPQFCAVATDAGPVS
jgi:hypothetical protein